MTSRTRYCNSGNRPVTPHWVTPRWGSEYFGDASSQGVALGYRVNAPLARKSPRNNHFPGFRKMVSTQPEIPRTNGAKPLSLGQRPKNQTTRDISRTNGAKPLSLGHRPRKNAQHQSQALKGRNRIDADHFVDVNKMIQAFPSRNPETLNSDAAVPGLSRQQAYTLEMIVPPTDLLLKFCTLADSFGKQTSMHCRQNQNLRRTRDLLLPKLLNNDDV